MNPYSKQLDKERLEEMQAIVTTITGYMVLPLYLAFWFSDLVYAPQFKWEFLFLRCLVIPVAILANYYVNRTKSLTAVQNISLVYVFTLAAIIDGLMVIMAEPITPYYTGLILIATGALGFFPWSRRYFVYVVLSIFIPYYLIVFSLNPDQQDFVDLIIISFFISATVTILWVIRFFRETLRIKEITARLELNSEIDKRKTMERELICARDHALQASQAKSAFLANMSHELRTPLNAIIGYSELLQESVADGKGNDKNCVQDLKKIDSAGQHLLKLINGVLDISKIEAGQMEIHKEKFDLGKLVKDIEVTLRPSVEKNNNRFIVNCPDDFGDIYSDETMLRQTLFNLLSNAGKFTSDGNISLTVSALMINTQEWLRFDVTDTGIGMTPDQLSKVFNAFTQADSGTTKKYGGTGLGLSICWHFCKLLGGEVFVKSKDGKGSVFTVLIPRYYDESFSNIPTRELEKIVLADSKL